MRTDGCSNWPDIEPPQIILPTQGASVSRTLGFTITCSPWVSSTLQASTYDYELWSGQSGTGTKHWSAYNDMSLGTKAVPALSFPLGQMYARVKANSVSQQSSWSADRSLIGV